MRKLFILLVALCFFSFNVEEKKIRLFMAGDSTMSIKDPKSYPETGWGMPFTQFWNSNVEVVNKAKNGRSTKTFRAEGLWNEIISNANEGDYIFIQFGHNDEVKEKVGSYTTPEEFTSNLKNYIAEAKSKKAIPVLLTPVARRKFDSNGKIVSTHEQYANLVRQVAFQEKVILIDHDTLSMDLYQQMGEENSRLLFVQLKAGEHPNYPDGKEDNTHFNELGARLVAQLVLKSIKEQLPELTLYVRNIKPNA
jgi:lysophospholipase L1-like esterase